MSDIGVSVRPMTMQDYGAVVDLWRSSGISVTLSDAPAETARMLSHNPATCLVAEADGKVIGVVLGGFDGRRGFVHHLAVAPDRRKTGLGRLLMEQIETKFAQMGVVKITFLVEVRNKGVLEFYKKLGYTVREDLIAVSKTMRTS